MSAKEGDSIEHGTEATATARRISGDKPAYPVSHRPANPHAPPRSRQESSDK